MTMAWKLSKTASACAVLVALGASASQEKADPAPQLTGVIAFLYYEDF